jgi:3-deoxy-manno-octulosonate cytidylyltransferase (CMP-KDO synthetase)
MTRADHQSGTDRTFEVALKHHHELILNVQGDEPFAPTAVLAQVCQEFAREKKFGMATLACPTADAGLFRDPNCVKVATNAAGAALYFSRAPIPWPRDGGSPTFLRHAGVYFFRRHALKLFCTTPPAKTELTEKLEQLRAFDAGIALKVYETNDWPRGVDTAEDLEAARARLGKS